LGGFLRTTLRSLRLQWILHRAQRRKARAIEHAGPLNPHMLRDIGVSNETILPDGAARPVYERHGLPFGLALLLVALALDGTATPASADTAARAGDKTQARVSSIPAAGVFAGEYVDGAPVYRFPAVVVTGSRKEGASANAPSCRRSFASAKARPCGQSLASAVRNPVSTMPHVAEEFAPAAQRRDPVPTARTAETTAARSKRHIRGSPRALTLMVAPGAEASCARWVTPRNT
jgi:uncharacterized protein YjiS (DUF1127 family)